MNKYYIQFKTWREGYVEMPGKHRVLGELNEYRKRSDLTKNTPASQTESVFLSFNETAVAKFLDENVPACVVGLVVENSSEAETIDLVDKNLGPIELIGIALIDSTNEHLIKEVMGDALDEHPQSTLDS